MTRTDDFVARGFDERDALSRAAFVERASHTLTTLTGAPPHWRWFVPGRIEVFGKHTDYAGGRSLLCAVPRGLAVVASPRDDGIVRVADGRTGQSTVIPVTAAPTAAQGWARYVAVVVDRLSRNFLGAALGTDVAIVSDLPRSAGLSSSSALVVGIATALIRRGGLTGRPEWRASIPTSLELASYLGAVENGQSFAALAGSAGVGTFGGSEDHTAILHARAGLVSAFGFVPARHLGDAAVPADWRFIVATSGVAASKTGGARDRYNRASLASRALVELWQANEGPLAPTLAAALRVPDALTRFAAAIARSSRQDFPPDHLRRRLAHFVAEDGRIEPALEAFRRGSAADLRELASASQSDAEQLLGNQTPETSTLARVAYEVGAIAATSFGAGFGGSVWAVVPAESAESIATAWLAAYRAVHPAAGASAEFFIARPGPGLSDLSAT